MLLDLSWSDYNSKRLDAFEVLREIPDRKPNLPVSIYSTHNRQRHKRQARELGARGYVTKGVRIPSFMDAIHRATRNTDDRVEYC